MRLILSCVLVFAFGQHLLAASETAGPVMDGPEGQLAFDGLTAFYAGKGAPDASQAMRDLNSTDADIRGVAGKYLLALFRQSMADESDGRSQLQQTPFWGGGGRSPARDFRRQLASEFSSASAHDALGAALWLVNENPDAQNAIHGSQVLCRIRSPRSEDLFQEILTRPHPCPGVLENVLDEVGERKLTELRTAVETLFNHFRSAVRDAARKTAALLGTTEFSDFDPSKALTPWLDEQIHQIDSMVMTKISEKASWIRVGQINDDQHREFHHEATETFGWLLSEDESSIHVLTWHNQEAEFQKASVKTAPVELADTAKMLARQRYERPFQSLSVQGDLTGQFEPNFEKAAENAVDLKLTDAYPILTRRIQEFSNYEGSIVEICSRLNMPASAVEARSWILSPREATQFWGALILLKHGDVAAAEGLETVERILADDNGTNYYSRAIGALLALGSERSSKRWQAVTVCLRCVWTTTAGQLRRPW